MQALKMLVGISIALFTLVAIPSHAEEDFIVYSVYKNLDFGNPGEVPQKDYYVNMGTKNGLKKGTILMVIRKAATYDLTSQKLYKDVSFPIAKVRVIHTESNAAVARLEKMAPTDKTPAITPNAIMVGDSVQISE